MKTRINGNSNTSKRYGGRSVTASPHLAIITLRAKSRVSISIMAQIFIDFKRIF